MRKGVDEGGRGLKMEEEWERGLVRIIENIRECKREDEGESG
jgi:hypothetical protein